MAEKIIHLDLLCVSCPKGCLLKISLKDEKIVQIESGCKRGEEYARQELVDPRRMIATTIRVNSGVHPLVPVYTEKPIPKNRIIDLMKLSKEICVDAPVFKNDVIFENLFETGINLIVSRDMKRQSE